MVPPGSILPEHQLASCWLVPMVLLSHPASAHLRHTVLFSGLPLQQPAIQNASASVSVKNAPKSNMNLKQRYVFQPSYVLICLAEHHNIYTVNSHVWCSCMMRHSN